MSTSFEYGSYRPLLSTWHRRILTWTPKGHGQAGTKLYGSSWAFSPTLNSWTLWLQPVWYCRTSHCPKTRHKKFNYPDQTRSHWYTTRQYRPSCRTSRSYKTCHRTPLSYWTPTPTHSTWFPFSSIQFSLSSCSPPRQSLWLSCTRWKSSSKPMKLSRSIRRFCSCSWAFPPDGCFRWCIPWTMTIRGARRRWRRSPGKILWGPRRNSTWTVRLRECTASS